MRLITFALLLAVASGPLSATAQELPKYEFRGAWIATVANLDWPTSPTSGEAAQKAELLVMLDRLQESGINAVLFQVRTEADAFYDSPFEPTSYWLTGEQGSDPGWDPLAFAIEESHARGMELHAWFNPYRADRGSNYAKDPMHVTLQHPEWVLDFGAIKILDPGLPEVRDYVTSIITDVAERYDIDGVHFDDYFYPYPPNTITNEDADSFAQYGGSFSIGNWRRFNVFRFVRQIRDSLAVARPDAVFGISPFGIARPGVPQGISGLDAFNVLFADPEAWLRNDLIDYVTPQLYWPFGGGQDYGKLAPWWESVRSERHLYPGHGVYRSSVSTFSGNLYAADEVPRQIRLNRTIEGIQGSVFFRAENITRFNSRGFSDSLKTDLYRYPALPPPMAWRDQSAPGVPEGLARILSPDSAPGTVDLIWQAPSSGTVDARFYAVYRIPSGADLEAALEDSQNLIAVTGETKATDFLTDGRSYTYVVTSVSANSIESAPSEAVVLPGAVASEQEALSALVLEAPRPNPSAGPVTIPFVLEDASQVTLRVMDVLGREVAVLEDGPRAGGSHSVVWQPAAAGTYLIVLEADGARLTRTLSVVR